MSGNEKLINAARDGDLNTVKYLVDKGANVHDKNELGSTPLIVAADRGHLDIVKYLMDKGASVHDENEHGLTPLILAAWHGHLDIVKYLMDKGANVYDKNKYGDTPLLVAADRGHLDMVKYLMDKGANVYDKDKYGDTPLLLAARHGHLDIVKYLVDKGANPTDLQGDEMQSMTKKALETAITATPVTLWSSVAQAKVYLNSLQSDIQMVDKVGATPLMHSAYFNKLDWIKLFEGMKGQVDNFGNTALHYAACGDSVDAVKHLLGIGVDSSQQNKDNDTAFDAAVMRNSTQVLSVLLEKATEADLDRGILKATTKGNTVMLQTLLESGQPHGSLHISLDLAVKRNHVTMVDLLQSYGAKVCAKHMIHASSIGSIELARCLVEHGGNVDAIYQEERPLLITIQKGYVYMTKWLLENGSQQAQVGLPVAIESENIEMCRLLLAHGASVLDLELDTTKMKPDMKELIIHAYLKQSSADRIDLKKQVTTLEDKIEYSNKQMAEKLERCTEQSSNQMTDLADKLEQTEEQSKTQMATLKSQLEQSEKEYNKQMTTMEATLDESEKKAKERVTAVEETFQQSVDEYAALKSQLEQSDKQAKERITSMEKKLQQPIDECATLKTQLEQSEKEYKKQMTKFDKSEKEHEKQMTTMTIQINSLITQLEEMKGKVDTMSPTEPFVQVTSNSQ